LQRYNELKLDSIGLDEDSYRARKSAFIEKVLLSAANWTATPGGLAAGLWGRL